MSLAVIILVESIGGDLIFDFCAVRAHVIPSVCSILGRQPRVIAEQLNFTHSKSARLFKHPHGNARLPYAGRSAHYARHRLDAWKSIPQVADDPLQQLGLFSARQVGDNGFSASFSVLIRPYFLWRDVPGVLGHRFENIYLCFQAFPQAQIKGADFKPTIWLLVEI